MNKKRTILFVAPYFPPHSGGLERYVSEVAKRINTSLWRVVVLTTSEKKEACTEQFGECEIHRLKIDFKVSNTPFSFSWFKSVHKLLKEVQPDVVNVHMPVPGLGDIVSLLLPGSTPLVVTYHGESMRKGAFLTDLLIWCYEHSMLVYLLVKARHVVCSSDSIRKHFLRNFMHKSTTIYPGVDTNLFVPDVAKKAQEPTVLFVAGLGRGEEHKGLDTLVKAMVIVHSKIPEAKLVVVGDGNKRAHYAEKVAQLGIADTVSFKGKLQGKELVETYQQAHLFVLPTKNESFGMVIAEAMATALPVISTEVGGVPYLVEDGVTGVLIKPGLRKTLANRIIALLQDADTRRQFGETGRKKMEEGFRWEQRAQAYEAVFENVCVAQQSVAHIVGYYPPHVGGMEIVAREIAQELARTGKYMVRVFTSTLGSQHAPHVERDTNITVRRLRSWEFAHTPCMWSLPLRLLLLPRNTILHVHLAQVGIPEIALLVAKVRRFPLIFHFHLDVEPSGNLGWLFLLYKKHLLGIVLRSAQKIIVFSEEQRKFVETTYRVPGERVEIIPNGVSVKYFALKRVKRGGEIRLLYAGRLTIQKRLERLIGAMPLLTFKARLTIVGEGEDREKLERLVKDKRIQNVTFTGRKTHKQVQKYYQRADMFVIPSDKEGMPMVVLEAMAAGVPVVASNVMGLRETVQHVGVLVDDVSPEGFAQALNTFAANPEHMRRAREQGRVFARSISWPVIVAKIDDVYQTV